MNGYNYPIMQVRNGAVAQRESTRLVNLWDGGSNPPGSIPKNRKGQAGEPTHP